MQKKALCSGRLFVLDRRRVLCFEESCQTRPSIMVDKIRKDPQVLLLETFWRRVGLRSHQAASLSFVQNSARTFFPGL